ncbi:MAG TPA: CvpA family protein [Candidatus Cloacimonadota bacterium]|nr:CvpA family protein [Candidatus Cloacimonadota bacterium]HPT72387.1 CvpA family protein [Candidatus Cloacimonadota bacterium]
MHVLDIILSLILVVFIVFGYRKGLIGELLQLAGLIATFLLVGRFAPLVKAGLIMKWHLGPFLATLCSYLIIFILIAIIIQLVRMAMEHFVEALNLNFLNRSLGAAFGLLSGLFFFAIILILIDLLPLSHSFDRATMDSKVIKTARIMKGELLGVMEHEKVIPPKKLTP